MKALKERMKIMTCKECRYYKPDYGIFTATGWTGDGSNGYCCVEPKRIYVESKRVGCRHFVSKYESECEKNA
jgi:hypothetical protein